MPTPTSPRTARARRTATVTALLSVALTAGLALGATAAPANPLVPETSTPEMHPVEPGVGEIITRLERAEPAAPMTAPVAPTPPPAAPTPGPAPTSAPAPVAPTPAAATQPLTNKSFTGSAFPSCAAAGGSTTLLAEVHSKKTRNLRWVLTDDGAVTKTGKLKVKGQKSASKVTKFSVADLAAGTYHLDFRKAGSSKVSVRLPVLVLGCVEAAATCRSISFSNPAGNPAVELDYGPVGEDDEGGGGFFSLEPGASRTVRTDTATVVWSAYGMTPQTQSSAGEALSLPVPQDCPAPPPVPGDNSLTSYGLAACLRPGTAGAQFELGFERLKDIAVRFEVRNAADAVVLHGDAGDQVEAVGVLPTPGVYRYRTYLNGSDTAYEDVQFTVVDCLRVERTCTSVTFTNPNPGRVEVDFSTKTGKHAQHQVIASGAATEVNWTYTNLRWFAYPAGAVDEPDDLGPRIVTIAGDADQPRPTNC